MVVARNTITALGDSQTDPVSQWVLPEKRWPTILAAELTRRGGSVRGRNFGRGGELTNGGLARCDVVAMYDTPVVAFVDLGVNDPGTLTDAQTQANLQAIIKSWKYGAWGPGLGLGGGVTVADQTALPANGVAGQRYVVLADTATTGGVAKAANDPTQHASITTDLSGGAQQTVWENRNPLAGVYGWGRVAVAATAPWFITRIGVLSTNYLNWTTGGDTPSGGTPSGAPYSSYPAIRADQQAAASAENVAVGGVPTVVYIDLFNFQKARILAGTDLDFSSVSYDQARSWHIALNNQHHNQYGDWLKSQAILAGLPAAWLTALTS